MTASLVPFGTEIALEVRDSSAEGVAEAPSLRTLDDLLDILGKNPPKSFAMLRATSNKYGEYLARPTDQIPLDTVWETKEGFRPFLERGKYAANSIRSYVNYVCILLRLAKDLGWNPNAAVPEAWRGVLALAAENRCTRIVEHFSRTNKTPGEVTIEAVERWMQMRVEEGRMSSAGVVSTRKSFWGLLLKCGCTDQVPTSGRRWRVHGIPLKQFPLDLKNEVERLLHWKCAEYSGGRRKNGRHREITSRGFQLVICAVYGFAVHVLGESAVASLPELVQERVISAYVDWSINERKVKVMGLQTGLGMLAAAMQQHPAYRSIDYSWFPALLRELPAEPKSELKNRKAEKYVAYEVLQSIPAKIRAGRPAAAKKGVRCAAWVVMQELLMAWLPTLPWRQHNLRGCRISGPAPNLFKGPIPPLSQMKKPAWVLEQLQVNPEAHFWQFRFSAAETKTKVAVSALLPRQLIGLLEEYLGEFRGHLIRGNDPGTLFVNTKGKVLTRSVTTQIVATLTLRHAGRRVTPHLYRDITAYAWLDDHPDDFLRLSKILWHSNINTTIEKYGGRFNESNGVCAMESWLEEREANNGSRG